MRFMIICCFALGLTQTSLAGEQLSKLIRQFSPDVIVEVTGTSSDEGSLETVAQLLLKNEEGRQLRFDQVTLHPDGEDVLVQAVTASAESHGDRLELSNLVVSGSLVAASLGSQNGAFGTRLEADRISIEMAVGANGGGERLQLASLRLGSPSGQDGILSLFVSDLVLTSVLGDSLTAENLAFNLPAELVRGGNGLLSPIGVEIQSMRARDPEGATVASVDRLFAYLRLNEMPLIASASLREIGSRILAWLPHGELAIDVVAENLSVPASALAPGIELGLPLAGSGGMRLRMDKGHAEIFLQTDFPEWVNLRLSGRARLGDSAGSGSGETVDLLGLPSVLIERFAVSFADQGITRELSRWGLPSLADLVDAQFISQARGFGAPERLLEDIRVAVTNWFREAETGTVCAVLAPETGFDLVEYAMLAVVSPSTAASETGFSSDCPEP